VEVTITIDDKQVTAQEGMTVFQAAQAAGIKIPHLCYHEKLPPTGACRMCVVEVEKARSLVTSCTYPVTEGMVVRTNTERVVKARKLALELLLSDHPLNCMVCEKAGNCKLQDYAYEYGIAESPFAGERHEYPIDTSNPFIVRDYNKCILCGRCIAACSDIQATEALDRKNRGYDTRVIAGLDQPLQDSPCVFCGRCISVCPVGALTEKQAMGKGREWDFKRVRTICNYCGCGCTIELNLRDGRIVKVTNAEDSPVAGGSLCVKGKFGWDFIQNEERLRTPLIKENGKFREASWDEALNLVASKLSEIREENGADSVAVLSSAKCSNEENYLLQKFARAVIGTNNVDHCARL